MEVRNKIWKFLQIQTRKQQTILEEAMMIYQKYMCLRNRSLKFILFFLIGPILNFLIFG